MNIHTPVRGFHENSPAIHPIRTISGWLYHEKKYVLAQDFTVRQNPYISARRSMESPDNLPAAPAGDERAQFRDTPPALFPEPFDKTQAEELLLHHATTVADLRFMNERFQYACMATHDVVWDWNLADGTIWWSDTFQTAFGYAAGEVKHTVNFWYDLIHPEDRDRVVNGIHQVIDSGQANWSDTYSFRKADGTYATIQDRGYVRHGADNRPMRMVGSMRDITQAKRGEEQLLQQTERLRLALESAELGTWDFDPLTRTLDWDARCKELFGLSPGAYVDWDVFVKGLHPDDRERVEEINRDAMAEGSDGRYDCEYRTVGIEDGKLRWIRAKGRSYFDTSGRAQRYIGTVLDITARKMHEQKLMEQERLFRLLVTSIPQIVWTTDTAGKTDYISQRWEDYTGASNETVNRDFASFIHADDLGSVVTSWQESLQEGAPWSGEYRLRDNRAGQYRWFRGVIAPLKDERGAIVKWVGSAADIHDQKLVEQELERRVQDRTDKLAAANGQLQQSNRELEQFAYAASHDLQEPLRKVNVYLGLLKTVLGASVDEKAVSYFHKIEKATTRMSSLIKNLLEYSRLDKDQAVFEDVDLNKIMADVTTDLEVALAQKSITLTAGDLPVVRGVPHQLTQLFYNLVGNAIKFSRPDAERYIHVAYTYDDVARCYTISVTDNGIGFDQQYATKMFEIFQRLTTVKSVGGHGIGLAICQKIVHHHNGKIWATGSEGMGATFFVQLPAY
jgi:PAS domain S-box-containing protein